MNYRDSSNTSEPPSDAKKIDAQKRTLTRQDIALALYARLGNISHREAKRLTDSVIDEMVDTLSSGETLKLHDFGSFVVRSKHERAGRNPRTGEPVPIQARRVIVFKASPNMKAAVNGEETIEINPAPPKSAKDGSGGSQKPAASRARVGRSPDATPEIREAALS